MDKYIYKTLDNSIFFCYNERKSQWKYKNKSLIEDKKVIDSLNEVWYNKYKGGVKEIFIWLNENIIIENFVNLKGE